MRWRAGDRSNVQDLRGGGGGMGVPLGVGGLLVLLVGSWLTGVNLFDVVGSGSSAVSDTAVSRPANSSPQEEQLVDFVDAVMGDIQKTWSQQFSNYQPTQVRLFRNSIQSACGYAGAATGPFYCPGDRKVYLDLGFFDELARRFGAPGDFAQAYVLAHEIGHHIQTLTGTEGQMRQMQRSDPGNTNALSVRLELQADCYAGVWGHEASRAGRAAAGGVELDPGDMEAALHAAAAIGDDRLQKLGTGRVMPEKFTHGSSEQRVTWFKRGFDSGDPKACNTFQ